MRYESWLARIGRAVPFLLLGACSAVDDGSGFDTPGAAELALDQNGECLVSDEVVEHSCLHAEFGPFAAVSAQPYPGTVFSNIDTPHTAYTVTLPASGSSYAGAVRYRPTASGDHAFFLTPGTPLALFTNDGVPVPIEREGEIPDELCALIERVGVTHLEAGESYIVSYGPSTASGVQTIIEFLGDGGCQECEHVLLSASRSWRPPNNSPAEELLEHPIAFEVPATIPITEGSACFGTVTFAFRNGDGPLVNCLYSARPAGPDFALLACSGGVQAGDDVEANYFRLRVNPFGALHGAVTVELELEDEACSGHDHEHEE
jgi:hypothetical protein